jgi:surfeit locus 1 family protein
MALSWSRSNLVAIAALAALAALFVALGRWQWQRAAESRGQIEQFATAAREPALEAPPNHADSDEARYRRLQVRGRYEPAVQFLLDNRVHAGVAGYEVLTPFRALGADRWLLVNRGWIRGNPDRSILPDVSVDVHERSVRGRVDTLPRPGLALDTGMAASSAAGVRVVSYPSAATLAVELDAPIFAYQVLLDADQADGYIRDWRVAGPLPERHTAYAGQWFLLAATAAILSGAVAIRSRKRGSP